MPQEISIFGGTLPFTPKQSEESLAYHTNFNSQWLLMMILAQLAGGMSVNRALGPIREITVDENFAALASVVCTSVVLTNNSAKSINYRRGGSGVEITLPPGTGKLVDVRSNAHEIQLRNSTDTADAAVQYECNGEAV